MKTTLYYLLLAVLFSFPFNQLQAQSNQECLYCHSDKSLSKVRNGKPVSLYVNGTEFDHSIHGDMECIDCHQGFDPENIPHKEGKNIYKVDCSFCHEDVTSKFEKSLHGVALKEGKTFAPNCYTCHTKHNILSHQNPESKTFKMNVPVLCGSCHKEGTEVNKLLSVSKHNVFDSYSQSIHGDGLYRRGLIVTAVCTSCHNSHEILPHENPESSINRNNIANTCMQCHSQIEQVHRKVIRGELWEKKPHQVPACIDCHQPHKVRRVFYQDSFPDDLCMKCHASENIYKVENGERINLHVDLAEHKGSVHGDLACVKCHTEVSHEKKPVCLNSGRVDCSMCHSEQASNYDMSRHGELFRADDKTAPYCTDCHGEHNIMRKDDIDSPIFSRNIPELCGKCHTSKAHSIDSHGKPIVKNYSMSIHGKGLIESGLMVTATCVDCHTSHRELPETNPLSSVNSDNIAETCAKCHLGIYEAFKKSVHSSIVTKTDKELPTCDDCHFSHEIERVDKSDFRSEILERCGRCHEEVAETYFDTFHGKVSKLGSSVTAKCSDCHGAHNILPPSNPESKLSHANIVETCRSCHPNSNRKFTGYLTHATHHDKDKYPYLYYTFIFMSTLLVGTFLFFGLHTLLWLPRALKEKRKHMKAKKENNSNKENENA